MYRYFFFFFFLFLFSFRHTLEAHTFIPRFYVPRQRIFLHFLLLCRPSLSSLTLTSFPSICLSFHLCIVAFFFSFFLFFFTIWTTNQTTFLPDKEKKQKGGHRWKEKLKLHVSQKKSGNSREKYPEMRVNVRTWNNGGKRKERFTGEAKWHSRTPNSRTGDNTKGTERIIRTTCDLRLSNLKNSTYVLRVISIYNRRKENDPSSVTPFSFSFFLFYSCSSFLFLWEKKKMQPTHVTAVVSSPRENDTGNANSQQSIRVRRISSIYHFDRRDKFSPSLVRYWTQSDETTL